ncbi:MAG: insulinase family protein [Candidatus Riflebacteria bacterium]|nr:insulinase family protein [Candidatus Riflebacteria bacterium]
MPLELNTRYYGFRLIENTEISELKATAQIFVHEKSGAKLFYLANEDDNKVFSISFRTPPSDNSGLPHILEHSVLCGSRKFPTRAPLIELAKGSLNTFINARTFADKTMYPVASKNDKDFRNLMNVYLDAVLHPNIYKQPEILMQEGWHYELDNVDGPLRYNGVVYNEMKGSFSSPECVLGRKILESLYPDTPYGLESGGEPDVIPELTQEQFLDFHRKYYHPSNSYIYLYGKLDIVEQLKFISEAYLNDFDVQSVDSAIPLQEAFSARREMETEYSISDGENIIEQTYLALNFSIGRATDPDLYLAFNILEYLLLDSSASPIKKALLEAGIGKDVFGVYDDSILQPAFSIVAKNAEISQKDAFVGIIQDTLKQLIKDGIDKKQIEAAINHIEFELREADYGGRPLGLLYAVKCMDSWLYGEDPKMHLAFEAPLAKVKKALTEPLFESLIEKYLLNNTHSSLLVVKPSPGIAEKREKEIHEELQAYKKTLGEEELLQIIRRNAELKEKQSTPDAPEALATIPMIALEDIEKTAETLPLKEEIFEGVKTLFHPASTNGIAYTTLYFDTSAVPEDLLPYIGLLASVLGESSTKNLQYEDLANQINIHTGGIEFYNQAFALSGKDGEFVPKFIVEAKSLVTKLPDLMRLLTELIIETCFEDTKRLKEIIQEARSRLEMDIYRSGHVITIRRLSSYFSPAEGYSERLTGISFYKFLVELERDFDNKKDDVVRNLQNTAKCIFQKNRLLTGITMSEEDLKTFKDNYTPFLKSLSNTQMADVPFAFEPSAGNEALMTPGKGQYVAKGYSFVKMGHAYSGSLQVLQNIAGLDYLWNRVRLQGGAYGVFANFTRSGSIAFASYRDPNLKETLAIYDQFAEYLENFDADTREITKYIIGTISRMDSPLTPKMRGERAVANYLSGITQIEIQKERDEILNVTPQTIRSLATMVRDVLQNPCYCVLGGESKIRENKGLFKHLVTVFE